MPEPEPVPGSRKPRERCLRSRGMSPLLSTRDLLAGDVSSTRGLFSGTGGARLGHEKDGILGCDERRVKIAFSVRLCNC